VLRNGVLGVVFLTSTITVVAQSGSASGAASRPLTTSPALSANYGKLPLSFEANQGQSARRVRFTSRGNGYSLFLTGIEAVLALSKENADESAVPRALLKSDVIRMQLAGENPGLTVAGEERLPGTANYFIGNDATKWHSSVPTYAKVRYSEVYPGVDLVYYWNQRQLEYDLVVAPGADPNEVKLHFVGAKLSLNADGDLMVAGENGEIAFHKPVVYQVKSGETTREPIDGRFALLADNTVGFSLGTYDRGRVLVIDPTLAYSTYLGGSGLGAYEGDSGAGIAVDSMGNTYVTGTAYSTDFPVTDGAFQTMNNAAANGNPQAFITKLNASGTALLYSTYLGGDKYDYAYGIAVDDQGSAYVTGSAASADFPTTKGAFQTKNGAKGKNGGNGFVTKLSADGSELIYSTFLGGTGDGKGDGDTGAGIALGARGVAYITGSAYSPDFPVSEGAFQTVNNGKENAFVTELSADGTALGYSTYLGGNKFDAGAGIAVDRSGSAYVTGTALSGDFPTTAGAFQTKNAAKNKNGGNAFVTKLNLKGTALLYSTFLGGSGDTLGDGDAGFSIALDACGSAYVTGPAFSSDFPVTKGAFQTAKDDPAGTANAFVAKLSSNGSTLNYSTYLGGDGGVAGIGDYGYSIAVSPAGIAYVTGFTQSSNFPVTKDAYQPTNKAPNTEDDTGSNVFLTKLNSEGTALRYSTYLGGSINDVGAGIALDYQGDVYVTGYATSTDFPVTKKAYQTGNNAGVNETTNAFVAKFSF
jgi:Beta-propeller repeat